MARGEGATLAPARRRREDTGRGFRMLARKVGRRFGVRQGFNARAGIARRTVATPAEVYAGATRYLSTAFDLLTLANEEAGDDCGESFDTEKNHISPQP